MLTPTPMVAVSVSKRFMRPGYRSGSRAFLLKVELCRSVPSEHQCLGYRTAVFAIVGKRYVNAAAFFLMPRCIMAVLCTSTARDASFALTSVPS